MNVIFLTMASIHEVKTSGIYQDLMRKFRDEGHTVYIATPLERRLAQSSSHIVHYQRCSGEQARSKNKGSELLEVDGVTILKVRTLNLQKTNVVEKGIGQLLVETQFKRAIKKYLGNVTFDLILYSTPPITFTKVIESFKRKNPTAKSYLLLKDIFPQNAVDLGMMPGASFKFQVSSVKSWDDLGKYQLYKMFRRKEKKLYALSDYIGCMSPANVRYVIEHNPEVNPEKVEVAPNSIEAPCPPKGENSENESEDDKVLRENNERYHIRKKYNLPLDKPVFIYGGNLGKPQGIPFLIECLEANAHLEDCHFVVVGSGTEFPRLKEWYGSLREKSQNNLNQNLSITLMEGLPKEDYDQLVRSCDVGLIFLDHRFTIPNYPSRLLSYLENKMPVLCATDPNTDMGRIAEENGYGYWCESVRPEDFTALVDKMLIADRKEMGEIGYEFMKANYLVDNTYKAIVSHL